MPTDDRILGRYEGSGTWYDAAGKSLGYRIAQVNRPTDQGFEIVFKHDFDDGSAGEARLTMVWIAPYLLRVDTSGRPIGNGYCFADYCHYHLKVGGAFVEASYRILADGLEVYGSSSRNAEGLYIAWHETLRRTGHAE
jgi:hypothetical protein